MEKSRPKITISSAISIDGKISSKCNDSKLSSNDDLKRLHKLRSTYDAILVGKNTVLKDNPLLTVRFTKGKNPIRIILDSRGEIPKESKILVTSKKFPTIIAVSKNISKNNLEKLKQFPVEIIISGKDTVNLKDLLEKLVQKGIKSILVEGGGTTNWEFVKKNLFDEIIVTISPFLLGGEKSISFIRGSGFSKLSKSPKLKIHSIKRLSNHLVVNYRKV